MRKGSPLYLAFCYIFVLVPFQRGKLKFPRVWYPNKALQAQSIWPFVDGRSSIKIVKKLKFYNMPVTE